MSGAPKRVAVVGAGIAGLAAAYAAAQHPGWSVTLFEATGRLGGTIETVQQDGFTIECGPDSWVSDRSAARELAEELGLGGELMYSNDAIRRNYLAREGTLTPMPDGLRMMVPTRWAPILESPLFSWQARLAYLREPKRAEELKRAALARSIDEDESVRSFVTRHFGVEATETIAGPLLAGVFGGDIDRLSAGAVLAPFVAQEREHGSLIAPAMQRAAQQRASGSPPTPVFTTLRSGLGTLVDRIAASLPTGCIRRSTAVAGLARRPAGGWIVETASGAAEHFESVILATPADATRSLLHGLDTQAAALLPTEASSAVVVALCFAAQTAQRLRIPRGFGFLVDPSRSDGSKPELLAGTFMDQKFPDRAPQGAVFLRGFFGGQTADCLMEREDAGLVAAALASFARLLGPLPAPSLGLVRRWPRSLPQYTVGHPQRMRALAGRLEALPGLVLTGNAYHGVGLPALVHHARTATGTVMSNADSSPYV